LTAKAISLLKSAETRHIKKGDRFFPGATTGVATVEKNYEEYTPR
jgi:hypothetical protein